MENQQITLTRAAYDRYGAVTGYKNFRGEPMPKWEELPAKIQEAWIAAANPPRDWSNKIIPNMGEVIPNGTAITQKITLPYGGPLYIIGDTNDVGDGYHTFGELYEHRIVLWIALCKSEVDHNKNFFVNAVWRTKTHSDGSVWDGWFLLGITKQNDQQITYHLPMEKWDDCDFARTLDKASDFDGHTSADVLERIKSL